MIPSDVPTVRALQRVAVVGCGLIGGSFALASQRLAAVERVAVWDLDPQVRARARHLGVGDVVADRLDDAIADADLVLLGVPVAHITAAATSVVAHLRRPAVVTDVGSVKAGPVRDVEAMLAGHPGLAPRFVGGHPMAGREHSGVGAAQATLFQGAAWILTPTTRSHPAAFEQLGAYLRSLGARVVAVDPAVHDRLVAVASHLPHVLATALMGLAADAATTEEAVLTIAGGGFRDVTRIAASEPGLWVDILIENREAVVDALGRYDHRLQAAQHAVERQDRDTLRRLLAEGQEARMRLPGKPAAGPLVDVVVAVDDRPGSLAVVTTTLGEAGVNIEDLNMRHASDGARGALLLAVAGFDTAARAQQLLGARGFSTHLEPRSET